MYDGVPTTCAELRVQGAVGQLLLAVALATPKSITLGTGLPSCIATRMFVGFRSRWMIPFWWACCTAAQTGDEQLQPVLDASLRASQYSRDRHALNQLHHEEGPAVVGRAGVEQLGDVRMVHQRDGLPLGLEPRQDRLGRATLDRMSLTATQRLTGSVWSAIQTVPMPPSPICWSSLYRPAMTAPS